MKYANLHLHSNHSDGGFTPQQLVLLGKSLGYHALALTDHETDSGTDEMMAAGRKEGVEIISGAEFYGKIDGRSVHLTALDFDTKNPALRQFIKDRVDARYELTRWSFQRGINIGCIRGITWEDVLQANPDNAWLCIDSVINAYNMKKVPIPEDLREQVFKGPEVQAHTPPSPSAKEVIEVVRGAGGVIALAHPQNQTDLIPQLVAYGLNGVEVSHPHIYENTPRLAAAMARKYRLYRCGGTDHTGVMSCCGGVNAIPALQGISKEDFDILVNRQLD